MKKFFKYFLVALIILPCMFMFVGCNKSPTVVGFEKTATNGLYDTYTITYSDGTADAITIKNGEDANDVTVQQLYEAAKQAGNYGDEYTMQDFLEEYLNFDVEINNQDNAHLGALSAVAVYCEFPVYKNQFTNTRQTVMGSGAGVIYQPEGATDYYIITNYHVVYYASSISQNGIATNINCFLFGASIEYEKQQNEYVYGEDAIKCEYVGGSMTNDIAVLKVKDTSKIEGTDARPVVVADSNHVNAGDEAMAIGNPEGSGISMTKGIVSVDSEYIEMTAADNVTPVAFRVMRIDAAVNSGNSGGGLFNNKGELIGIVNSKIMDSSIENIGFALPSTLAIRVADNIIKHSVDKVAKRATVGITLETKNSRAVYDPSTNTIEIVEDVYISLVTADSLADGKLKEQDKIVSIAVDGKTYAIERMYEVIDLVWLMDAGDIVVFNVVRSNNNLPVSVVITQNSINAVK